MTKNPPVNVSVEFPGPNISEFDPNLKFITVDFAEELKELIPNPDPFEYNVIEYVPGGVT